MYDLSFIPEYQKRKDKQLMSFSFLHYYLSDMSSAYGTDVHRIYIFSTDKSGNVFYIIILLFFRNDSCNNTGKTTAMNTAYTGTDFFQEKLCQSKVLVIFCSWKSFMV